MECGGLRFNEYQEQALEMAIYPRKHAIIYPALKLAGEAGEVAEKIGKTLRDDNGEFSQEKKLELAKEIGDVLWYCAALAADLDLPLEAIAISNISKLRDRKARGVLQGSGDNR
jgi:NTP pyrophosphatase (non-canonical NTP hydrolase)